MVKKKVKEKKKKEIEEDDDEESGKSEEELDIDIGNVEEEVKKLGSLLKGNNVDIERVHVKGSKPIEQLKKRDKIKIDGIEFEIDSQYVLIDHGKTKEIAIDIFNPKTDKDYQLRYFSNQVETSLEFYELQEILYVRRKVERVEW